MAGGVEMDRKSITIFLIIGAILFLIFPIAIFYLGIDIGPEVFLISWIVSSINAWCSVMLVHLSRDAGKLKVIVWIIAILLSVVILSTLYVLSLVIGTP